MTSHEDALVCEKMQRQEPNFAPTMDHISILDYSYDLPADRIALYPLENRDESKLLVYKDGSIRHEKFIQVVDFLDVKTILFFNDTKVIPARLQFRKETGAIIEVMLLGPLQPALAHASMKATGSCVWKCVIGNQKRWANELLLTRKSGPVTLTAKLADALNGIVEFQWSPVDMTFAEVLHVLGSTPLPPYIKREATSHDIERYQTVYAQHDGAVAAPTAGLHFTQQVMDAIGRKGIKHDFVTLHVSAGTFLPVKQENALEHTMHEEHVVITRDNILNLLSGRQVVAVGTTTLRTLESVYWYGCMLERNPHAQFNIEQEYPYSSIESIGKEKSLHNVLDVMNADHLNGKTSIFIRPGYTFQVCDALITNFHQPGSTLMLLVATFIGKQWKTVYNEALSHDYRFLSYGDSSLLFKS
jgi:S-adenosylmethionine:tRNA ribosyltransferase-isomerase